MPEIEKHRTGHVAGRELVDDLLGMRVAGELLVEKLFGVTLPAGGNSKSSTAEVTRGGCALSCGCIGDEGATCSACAASSVQALMATIPKRTMEFALVRWQDGRTATDGRQGKLTFTGGPA
jgi:hypothetical protein